MIRRPRCAPPRRQRCASTDVLPNRSWNGCCVETTTRRTRAWSRQFGGDTVGRLGMCAHAEPEHKQCSWCHTHSLNEGKVAEVLASTFNVVRSPDVNSRAL